MLDTCPRIKCRISPCPQRRGSCSVRTTYRLISKGFWMSKNSRHWERQGFWIKLRGAHLLYRCPSQWYTCSLRSMTWQLTTQRWWGMLWYVPGLVSRCGRQSRVRGRFILSTLKSTSANTQTTTSTTSTTWWTNTSKPKKPLTSINTRNRSIRDSMVCNSRPRNPTISTPRDSNLENSWVKGKRGKKRYYFQIL